MNRLDKYDVVIDNDTSGELLGVYLGDKSVDEFIGKVVVIKAQDENGHAVQRSGVLTEVLEEFEY